MNPLKQRKTCCQKYKRLGFFFGNPLKPAALCADAIVSGNEKPAGQDASDSAQNSRREVAEAASNCLTRHLILVYSRGCCNVFKDLSGSKMSFFPFERGLVFEASSSYKNMYDEIFII
jgi:hypothetical protein